VASGSQRARASNDLKHNIVIIIIFFFFKGWLENVKQAKYQVQEQNSLIIHNNINYCKIFEEKKLIKVVQF